jgi:catechol 2,3-dioxygenase-like lactoylglutathione lyase family enzyme
MKRIYLAGAVLLAFCSLAATAADSKATPSQDPGPVMMGAAMRSSDLDRSIKYYTSGLGMVVTGRLANGPSTEVFLAFEGREREPGLIIFKDVAPGKSPPVEHGNAAHRVVFRIPDVSAIAARLTAAGYEAGEVHENGNVKILMIKDPDGYAFELVQLPRGEVKVNGSMQ